MNSEVSKHIHQEQPDHGVKLDIADILTVDTKWFERGVKEAIYIRALKPSLNKDGGRYNLPAVWTNIIRSRVQGTKPRGPRSSDTQ